MTKTTFLIIAIAMVGISPILNASSIFAETDNLPGGTSISISINNPSDGQVFQLAGLGVDVNIDGDASIGEGDPIKDTTIVYILDISGSMNIASGVDCNGDNVITLASNGPDSRLNCAKIGISDANQEATLANSSVDESGVGTFAFNGIPRDVDLGLVGTQLIVNPDHDGNSNTTPDIEDVVNGLTANGGTNYYGGLTAADTILGASGNDNAVIIFISDGQNNQGLNVDTFTPVNFPANTIINAFAIGNNVACDTTSFPSTRGNLDDVAAKGDTGSSCEQVTDVSTLADIITESIGSSMTAIDVNIDAGGNIPADSTIPLLPVDGPNNVMYAHLASSLGAGSHDICATAFGNDAGGSGSVEECVTIFVNTAPDCSSVTSDIDSIWPPNHKLVEVTLSGASDPDGDDVTFTITSVTQDEPTNGLGDGDKSPDAVIHEGYVELRAERSGNGDVKDPDGRVYEISYSVEDTNGGMCLGSVQIGVPHDKKDTAISSGQDYSSTS
jgi:hypothetical protein